MYTLFRHRVITKDIKNTSSRCLSGCAIKGLVVWWVLVTLGDWAHYIAIQNAEYVQRWCWEDLYPKRHHQSLKSSYYLVWTPGCGCVTTISTKDTHTLLPRQIKGVIHLPPPSFTPLPGKFQACQNIYLWSFKMWKNILWWFMWPYHKLNFHTRIL